MHELQTCQIELEMQNEVSMEAHETLKESRDRFVDFHELAPVGYLMITDEGLVADANLTAEALLCAERNEILQHRFSSFVMPGDVDRCHTHLFDALNTDGKKTCELGLLRRDGAQVHVRLDSLRLIKDGQTPALRVVLTDITANTQAKVELRESEALFKAMFDQAGVGVAELVSSTGRFVRVNQKYADIVGYSCEELERADLQAITHPDDLAPDLANMALLVAGTIDQFSMEKRYFHKDGRIVWVNLTVTPMRQNGGAELTSHIAIVEDITERKSIEIALRESEHRMRSFFDNVPVGIFISTRAGKFTYINPAMPKIMGYDSCEEMLDVVNRRSIAEVLYVDPLQRQALIANLDQKSSSWSFYENSYRCKDGRIITAEITISERIDEIAREPRLYGIVIDITKRKQAEADLIAAKTAAESASQAKSRFLAAASHDLRQPMQAIGLFVDALGRTSLSEPQKRISHYLEESAKSLGDLLNVLLDISKLDTATVKSCPEAIRVEALIHKIDADFSSLAAQKSLRFKLRFPFGEMAVMTDAKLLMSLLGNLIGNAIKYTEQGGILVAVRRREKHALIQIWDTGSGIAPEHMGNIFDEYFQVENQERDRTKGLGLGLAIVKRIANLLETEVVCRSLPGKGSVFEFRLPLSSPGERETRIGRIESPEVADEARPVGRHIVLVEDNLMVGTATKLALESCGMVVTSYTAAEEALADPAIDGADFYISDLRLGGLNGIELLDALQRRATKPIKALILTGDTMVDPVEMIRSTPWKVLFKPVQIEVLLRLIREATDASERGA